MLPLLVTFYEWEGRMLPTLLTLGMGGEDATYITDTLGMGGEDATSITDTLGMGGEDATHITDTRNGRVGCHLHY